MVLCVKVRRQDAEKARQEIAKACLLDGKFVPERLGQFVYFPVKGKPGGMKTVRRKLKARQEFGKPLRGELEGKLADAEMKALVGSFDIVGSVAVVEIPHSLVKKQRLIANAILKNHHNIKTVAKKMGGTAGEYRIRPVKVIAGEKKTHAIYREGGCEFELDLNKTYFSPRLGTERERIAALVEKDERVLVPFAGVGPFAIRIGKAVPSANVAGIELNPDAADYFARNIARNKCQNVRAICGDVRKILPGDYTGWADRVAMPLPKDGSGFLPRIIPCLKRGGVLHYYSFGDAQNPFEKPERQVRDAAAKAGRTAIVLFRRVVRPYSKTVEQVVVDAEID